jgi:hypothetical protein
MSNHWWRAYDEAVDDPKLQMLPDRLFRGWFNLCCLTSANGGNLPPIEVVAFKLRVSPDKATLLIANLREAGLIDIDTDGRRPHNWGGRQFKSDVTDPTAADRQKRYRNSKRNATVTPSVTVTPTETETDNRSSEAKASAPAELDLPPTPDVEFFRRGKQILGGKSGGYLKQLLQAKGGNVPLARAALETASTKQNPREYLGGVIRGGSPSRSDFDDPNAGII